MTRTVTTYLILCIVRLMKLYVNAKPPGGWRLQPYAYDNCRCMEIASHVYQAQTSPVTCLSPGIPVFYEAITPTNMDGRDLTPGPFSSSCPAHHCRTLSLQQ